MEGKISSGPVRKVLYSASIICIDTALHPVGTAILMGITGREGEPTMSVEGKPGTVTFMNDPVLVIVSSVSSKGIVNAISEE